MNIGERQKLKAQQRWATCLEHLNQCIEEQQYQSLLDIATTHGQKRGSFAAFLRKNYPEKLLQLRQLKKQLQIQKKNERARQRAVERLGRQQEKVARYEQMVTDLDNGLSIPQTAVKHNISLSTLCKRLKRDNIFDQYSRFKAHDQDKVAQALQLRRQGLTVRAIAAQLSIPKSSVHGWCQKAGL